MTSILSRLLTADKPWTAPYMVPVKRPVYSSTSVIQNNSSMLHQHNVVSGNDFPPVQAPAGKRKKTSKKTQDTSVRFGRVPKREKAKILAAMQKVNACSQEKALGAELEDEYKMLANIVQAHDETNDFSREKIFMLLEKVRGQPVYNTSNGNPKRCPLLSPDIANAEEFTNSFAPAITSVVTFTKRIPGFAFFTQDDQVNLLKTGVFEVLLVRLAAMFDSQSSSVICLNGRVLRRDSVHNANNARFLLDSMFEFAERMNSLHLTESEVALFCAVVIISADRPGLRNKELVMKVQQKIIDILRKSVHANHPEDPSLFNELMKKIPDLRTLNTLHSEKSIGRSEINNPTNRQSSSTVGGVIENMADTVVQQTVMYEVPSVPQEIWSVYSMESHPPCLPTEEELRNFRSTSPGQHSGSSSSSTGSEWSTADKEEHELVGSPTSIGICPENVKSPLNISSFTNTRTYLSEEAWPSDTNHIDPHLLLPKRPAGNNSPGSDHSSSGDEGIFVDSHDKEGLYPKLDRVDSPTDSGIDSGKEPSTSPTMSDCTSPPSPRSPDEKAKDMEVDQHHDKHDSIEDMPVLKRALQAPPIMPPSMLMDEAYRHHKKFRAARRAESPSSPSQLSLASTHSTLARTLERAPIYLDEQQLKRTDLIHNIIMQKETLPGQHNHQTLTQSHHAETQPTKGPFQNNSYPYNSVPNSTPVSPSNPTYAASNAQTHKSNLLVYQNGYCVPHSGNVQQTSIYTPATWSYGQQQSQQASAPVHVQYEPINSHQNTSNFNSHPVVNSSRSASPRLLFNSRSPASSLVINGIGHSPSSVPSSGCMSYSRPVQSESATKFSGESSQPLNLSKKLFSPPMLKMES